MSLESTPSSGQDLARSYKESAPKFISLEASPAQVFLSQAAYPNLAPDQAILKWVSEDAEAFRSYVDGIKERGESLEIDIKDHQALLEVIGAMRGNQTLH